MFRKKKIEKMKQSNVLFINMSRIFYKTSKKQQWRRKGFRNK